MLALGLLLAALGVGASVYNVMWGHDPDQAFGFQLIFTAVAVSIFEGVVLGAVMGLDATYRAVHSMLRRSPA